MKQCIPVEIMIIIIEMLRFDDAFNLCQALNIPEDLAFQYHQFDPKEYMLLWSKICDLYKKKIMNPHFSKALFKNVKFQTTTNAKKKVIMAIVSEDLEIFKTALEGPKIDHEDKWYSPFQLTCTYGQLDMVKLLVNEYVINISAHKNAALFVACSKGHDDIVKLIISHSDFNPENSSKALTLAIQSGNANVVRVLLSDERFDPSFMDNQAMIDASCRENKEIIQILLEDIRVDPSDQNNLAIINAAKTGNIEIVKLLLSDARVDPSDQKNQAIVIAAYHTRVEVVKILLEDPRVDPSAQDFHVILRAVSLGSVESVKLFLLDKRVKHSQQNIDSLIVKLRWAITEAAKIGVRAYNDYKLMLSDDRIDPRIRYNPEIISAIEKGKY